jgi:hypothetical protein
VIPPQPRGSIEDEPAGTEVSGDSAYGTGEFRQHLKDRDMTATIKPPPLRPAVEGGFDLDDFVVDFTAGTVTCPNDITVQLYKKRRATFGVNCKNCPLRHRCTTARAGRVIVLHEHHALLAQACTAEFDVAYRRRPMIERTLAWLVRKYRKLRYSGIERNQLGWAHRCAAINLQRLITLGLTNTDGTWTAPTIEAAI